MKTFQRLTRMNEVLDSSGSLQYHEQATQMAREVRPDLEDLHVYQSDLAGQALQVIKFKHDGVNELHFTNFTSGLPSVGPVEGGEHTRAALKLYGSMYHLMKPHFENGEPIRIQSVDQEKHDRHMKVIEKLLQRKHPDQYDIRHEGGTKSVGWQDGNEFPSSLIQKKPVKESTGLFKAVLEESSRDLFQDALRQLSKDRNPDIRHAVAQNRSAHPDTLHALSKDRDSDVRWSVAANRSTRPDTLHQLSKDKDHSVRLKVASNRLAHPDTLHQLSKDEDPDIRRAVGFNRSTHPDILHKLSKDKDMGVRWRVAANRSTHPDILYKLSKDVYLLVRDAVAENPSARHDTLHELSRDKNSDVRTSAKKALEKRRKKQAKPIKESEFLFRQAQAEALSDPRIAFAVGHRKGVTQLIHHAAKEMGFKYDPEWHEHYRTGTEEELHQHLTNLGFEKSRASLSRAVFYHNKEHYLSVHMFPPSESRSTSSAVLHYEGPYDD